MDCWFVPMQARGKFPVVLTPNKEYTGDTVKIAAETEELQGLIGYVQKLGMNRGKWRDLFEPQELEVTDATPTAFERMDRLRQGGLRAAVPGLPRGQRRRQWARRDLHLQSAPAELHAGRVQVQVDPKGRCPPMETCSGRSPVACAARRMPAWYELPLTDRLAVIQYNQVRSGSRPHRTGEALCLFQRGAPRRALYIGRPPASSQDVVTHGKEVWQSAKCWECHGNTGKGDGEKAAGLKDDFGFPSRPADLTSGQFKSGPAVGDIFRT